MKFAFLVMCELRGVKSTIENLYAKLIKPYNADVFICVQRALPDDEERMNLFHENVVHKEFYDKPDPATYFGSENNLTITTTCNRNNWNIYSNLQIYINYHEMAKVIENVYEQYDYFIIARTDSQILFPFPDKELFEKVPESIYLIDAQYCKCWGDIGIPGFIHKKYIMGFLNCYYNIISNKEYATPITKLIGKIDVNQEKFLYGCLQLCNLFDKIKQIKNINYYWTAEKINDYHTWSKPHRHPRRNIISKYDTQCDEAYNNYDLWNSGNYSWGINEHDMRIELSLKKHV